MKQYRRTRTEASKDGIRIAKALTKSKAIRFIHPLIKGCDSKRCTPFVVEKADFIRQLQTFRPQQTVLETGIGTSLCNATKAVKDSKGSSIMKAFRSHVGSALERNKVKATIYDAMPAPQEEESEGLGAEFDEDDCDEYGSDEETVPDEKAHGDDGSLLGEDKIRISRAARKRMKKLHLPVRSTKLALIDANVEMSLGVEVEAKRGFQDPQFYMSYGNEDEKATFYEASMQPKSNLKDREAQGANMLEYALLDIAPETATELNNKRRIMRWDAKKRKFVKQSLEEMAQTKGSKRIRTESGTVIKSSGKPQGEMYAKWKKRTHREISVSGDDERPRPNVSFNKNVKSELRNADEIRRSKKDKANVNLKNTRKDKRKNIESKTRRKKVSASTGNGQIGTKAGNRKVKIIMRR